jgi:hypothetical protein
MATQPKACGLDSIEGSDPEARRPVLILPTRSALLNAGRRGESIEGHGHADTDRCANHETGGEPRGHGYLQHTARDMLHLGRRELARLIDHCIDALHRCSP